MMNPKTKVNRDLAILCALIALVSVGMIPNFPNPWAAVPAKAEAVPTPYSRTPSTIETMDALLRQTQPELTCKDMLEDLRTGLKGTSGRVRAELKSAIEKGCRK